MTETKNLFLPIERPSNAALRLYGHRLIVFLGVAAISFVALGVPLLAVHYLATFLAKIGIYDFPEMVGGGTDDGLKSYT